MECQKGLLRKSAQFHVFHCTWFDHWFLLFAFFGKLGVLSNGLLLWGGGGGILPRIPDVNQFKPWTWRIPRKHLIKWNPLGMFLTSWAGGHSNFFLHKMKNPVIEVSSIMEKHLFGDASSICAPVTCISRLGTVNINLVKFHRGSLTRPKTPKR